MTPDNSLGDALRALPQAMPPVDLWPELAHRLGAKPARSRSRRFALPAALAASLLFALLWSRSGMHDPPPANAVAEQASVPGNAVSSTPETELDRLRARSQGLERWLAATSAQSPQDGRSLMAAAEVEDLVSLVDVQLSVAHNETDTLPLWRQRVGLLEDLTVIRSTPYALAADITNTGASMPAPL
jgi:hypothetical protein